VSNQNRSNSAACSGRLTVGDRVAHPHGGIELGRVLVVVRHPHRRPVTHGAVRRCEPFGQHLQERGLAGAVGPDDAEPLPRVEQQVDVLEQRRTTGPGEPDVVQLDDDIAEARRAEARQVEVAGSGGGLGAPLHQLRRRLDARLGLARARRGAPPQPRQLGAREVLAHLLGGGSALLTFDARLEPRRVPAFVHVAATPIDLDHARRDLVEHVPVMGDEEQAAAVRSEPLLQPLDRLDVEVVGRLVEDEEVGFLGQRAGQRNALGLATGQHRHIGVEVVAHAQPVEHRLALPPTGHRISHGPRGERRLLPEEADPHVTAASH
jgi:hypothetical protein